MAGLQKGALEAVQHLFGQPGHRQTAQENGGFVGNQGARFVGGDDFHVCLRNIVNVAIRLPQAGPSLGRRPHRQRPPHSANHGA